MTDKCNNSPRENWFLKNCSGLLPSLITLSVLMVSGGAAYSKLTYMVQEQQQNLQQTMNELKSHEQNRDIHIDPRRDDMDRQEILRRIAIIESELQKNTELLNQLSGRTTQNWMSTHPEKRSR